MNEFNHTFLHKLWLYFVGILIVSLLLQLPFMISGISNSTAHTRISGSDNSSNKSSSITEDSPNLVTQGIFKAGQGLGRATDSTEKTLSNGFRSTASSIESGVSSASSLISATASGGGKLAVRAAGGSLAFLANVMGSTFVFMIETIGKVFWLAADSPPVSAMIKPGQNEPVPVIGLDQPEFTAAPATTAVNTAPQSRAQVNNEAAWPISGSITAGFGVPHWPYQPTHTGIDISDGQRSGATSVRPFKSGRVIEVIHSRVGFGNHVIIDHGGGVTSLYGHMSSIAVQSGQEVDRSVVLGQEGSTGASTGPHVHFEVRLYGQPVDPRKYVSGQP